MRDAATPREAESLSEGFSFDGMGSPDLKLALALRAAELGFYDVDYVTGVISYDAQARRIFGFAPDQIIDRELIYGTIHEDDRARVMRQAQEAMDPSLPSRDPFVYRIVRLSDGETRWIEAFGEASFGAGDPPKVLRFTGLVRDVTERVRSRQALEMGEARLRLALEAARMAAWEVDVREDRAYFSDALKRMFGFPPEAEPTLDDLRGRYAPGERDKMRELAEGALARGERTFEAPFKIVRPDGERWLLLRGEHVLDGEGRLERVIGVLLDIDDARRADERRELMLHELNHRVKNALALAQSLASLSLRGHVPPAALDAYRARLSAIARVNDALISEDWTVARLDLLVDGALEPFRVEGDERFEIGGPALLLDPAHATPLAMALHELATNAAKHGALSRPEGRVSISWKQAEGGVRLDWRERGGPPAVPPQARSGFGNGFGGVLLVERLGPQLGSLTLDFAPEGLSCRIVIRDSAAPAREGY